MCRFLIIFMEFYKKELSKLHVMSSAIYQSKNRKLNCYQNHCSCFKISRKKIYVGRSCHFSFIWCIFIFVYQKQIKADNITFSCKLDMMTILTITLNIYVNKYFISKNEFSKKFVIYIL